MKILSQSQIREADQFTISHEPIASIDLMERAARKCSDWIDRNYGKEFLFLLICGNGNNGGDGLAIARLLAEKGLPVEIYILKVSSTDSADFSINLKRLSENNIPFKIISDADEIIFRNAPTIIIDAIFGSGLTREPENPAAKVIDAINSILFPKISIDIPSGLYVDDNLKNSRKHIVHASHTLTFQQPKLSFLFAENSPFVGEFHVLDIGLDQQFISQEINSPFYFVTHSVAKQAIKPRTKFSHKGTFGHALLVCGSEGKIGAAVLSARAYLHSGAGLLTVNVPKCGNAILQSAVPEAMLQFADGEKIISGKIKTGISSGTEYSAIGIGPGIGTEKETVQSMKLLLNEYGGPMVLDADAINILSENKTWLAFLPKGTILTPHPGEFDRLTQKHESGFERMKAQRELAIKYGIYIVLKGAHSSIACPDGTVFFNSSGNSGMATGGSGDALTGILTGLRAQGYNSQAACVLGVYLHGLAGDIAASVQSQHGMNAGDIIEHLGGAWRMIGQE